ncbi:serine hydrolase [Gemmiger formicilis]|uniref:serine hydrolase n=1 Tax=Gemmiger formicilis TaxID=745368 RepID=UPI00195BF0AB|nr:serine hydrolase [Gemmiger formicilis]MBM6916255.1 serine hydrolase [Gemmiger formicilis]
MKREEQQPGARRVYHKDPKAARRRHRRRRRLRTVALLAVLAMLACSVYWMLAGADGPDAEAVAPAPTATPAPTAQPSPEPDEEDGEEGDTAAPTATPAPAGDTPEQAQARAALDAYLDSLPGSVSVLAVRPSDGLTYARNADQQYYAASLLKAPYALWLYTRAAAGEVNLDEVLPGWSRTEEVTLSEEDAAAGLPSPTPKLVTVPDRTARAAVAEMVSKSSNGAAEQLYTRWPATSATGFADFLTGLGLDMTGRNIALSPATSMTGTLSASDAVKILTALQAFFDTGTSDALELKQAFLDARHTYLVTDWPMAKKYGNWKGALHDIAIVFAPDPYYAAVFTDWGDPVKVDPQYKEYYRQISALLTDLMES